MESVYLYVIAGILAPVVLALTAKAIKRVPADLREYVRAIASFIRS